VNTGQNPPAKRGCFFYGCISLIILSVTTLLLGYVGYRKVTAFLINEYTDSKPALIESVEVPPAQLQELQKRVARFKAALDGQKGSEELRLSAEDLNALIAGDPAAKDWKNKVFVMIDDDHIKGNISMPLDNFGPLKLKGRYLNGVAGFKASLENGVLLVRLQELEVKGKPLPAKFLAQLKQKNLAQDAQRDAKTAQLIKKFDSIEVTNGAVVLRSKEQ